MQVLHLNSIFLAISLLSILKRISGIAQNSSSRRKFVIACSTAEWLGLWHCQASLWVLDSHTDIHQRSQNLHHLDPSMGLNLGGLPFFFSVIKMKRNRHKRCTKCKGRECICFVLIFVCVVGKNPKIPKLNPMADGTITQGGTGDLGSLMNICDSHTTFKYWEH